MVYTKNRIDYKNYLKYEKGVQITNVLKYYLSILLAEFNTSCAEKKGYILESGG